MSCAPPRRSAHGARVRRRESGERMHKLTNRVRPYVWGARTAIPHLLGIDPDGTPQAELLLGAHTGAPSTVHGEDADKSLPGLIAKDPPRVLGRKTMERFGARLPSLLKYLPAEPPLSLQVHPDAARARSGYEAEERAGIPVDAPTATTGTPTTNPNCPLPRNPSKPRAAFRNRAQTSPTPPAWTGTLAAG